mgnify:CR=1 FL=1
MRYELQHQQWDNYIYKITEWIESILYSINWPKELVEKHMEETSKRTLVKIKDSIAFENKLKNNESR